MVGTTAAGWGALGAATEGGTGCGRGGRGGRRSPPCGSGRGR